MKCNSFICSLYIMYINKLTKLKNVIYIWCIYIFFIGRLQYIKKKIKYDY